MQDGLFHQIIIVMEFITADLQGFDSWYIGEKANNVEAYESV
jgi:hypothetical protein